MVSEQEIIDLSSLGDNEASLRTAADILNHKDPCSQIDRLYPALLKHQTLITAMAHLERAGADLERLTLSASLFRNLFPLNVLLPLVDHISADRIPLAAVRRQLDDHLLLLRRVGSNMANLGEQIPVIFLFGRAIEAAYPRYLHRVGYDIDVLTPGMDSGLHLVHYLREHLGLILFHCKISRLYLGWLAHFGCRTQTENGHVLSIDIFTRGRPFGAGPGILPPVYHKALFQRLRRVKWSGQNIWIPSAEDMLLTLADKIHRHGWISRKDFNDAQVILSSGKKILDWDYLHKEAVHHQFGGILHFLMRDAELRIGQKFIPPDLLARLAPSRLEKKFLHFTYPDVEQQRRSGGFFQQHWLKFWTVHFLLRYAKSSLRKSWIAVLVIRDNVQRRLFRHELRLAGARTPTFILFILRTMHRGFGSLCQLRCSKASPTDAFCLSQDASAWITRLPAGMDAESFHLLKQVAELIPLPADFERVCSRMGRRKKALLRLSHNCSSYSFAIGMRSANQKLQDDKRFNDFWNSPGSN